MVILGCDMYFLVCGYELGGTEMVVRVHISSIFFFLFFIFVVFPFSLDFFCLGVFLFMISDLIFCLV